MPLEPNFRYIDDLVPGNPADSDPVNEGDDHLRGIKAALQGTIKGDDTQTVIGRGDPDADPILLLVDGILNLQSQTVNAALNMRMREGAPGFETTRAAFRVTGAQDVLVENFTAGRPVRLNYTPGAGGGRIPFLAATPDAETVISAFDGEKARAVNEGLDVSGDAADSTVLNLYDHLHGTRRAYLFQNAAGDLAIANDVTGPDRSVLIQGKDGAGVLRDMITAVAGGKVKLGHGSDPEKVETTSSGGLIRNGTGTAVLQIRGSDTGEGGELRLLHAGNIAYAQIDVDGSDRLRLFQGDSASLNPIIVSGGSVSEPHQLYAGDQVVMQLEAATLANSRATVRDAGGALRPVGFNVMPLTTVGTATLTDDNCGEKVRVNGAGTITVPTGLTDDFSCVVINYGSSGILNINAGAGASLNWLNGAGNVAGNRDLLPGGVCTITQIAGSGDYYIWGTGLA